MKMAVATPVAILIQRIADLFEAITESGGRALGVRAGQDDQREPDRGDPRGHGVRVRPQPPLPHSGILMGPEKFKSVPPFFRQLSEITPLGRTGKVLRKVASNYGGVVTRVATQVGEQSRGSLSGRPGPRRRG